MTDLFNTESTQAQPPASQGDSALTTKLSAIVNENGEPKYANVETALDALKASQEFIPSLKTQVSEQEAEIARLREQVAKQTGVQEAFERFSAQQQTQAQPQVTEVTPTEQFGKQDVESLVQDLFTQRQAQDLAAANYDKVQSALLAAHGDQASNHIAKVAKEMNTTTDNLAELARTNPTMAMAILGAPASNPKPTSGSTNTTSFSQVKDEGLQKPKSSLMLGANPADVHDYMRQIREDVYKKHGIES